MIVTSRVTPTRDVDMRDVAAGALAMALRRAFARVDASAIAVTCARVSDHDGWTHVTYGELRSRAFAFGRAMRDLGYGDASSAPLGVDVRDGAEALTAYLGVGLAGAGARTRGRGETTSDAFGRGRTRGTMVEHERAEEAGSIVGAHEPIAVYGGTVREAVILYDVLSAAYGTAEAAADADADAGAVMDARYYFGSDRVTSGMMLVSCAERAVAALGMTSADAVCSAAPLGHAMGFGFAALAALTSGARLVIPRASASGVSGEDARRAMFDATLDAVRAERCTLVVADSHLTRVANERGVDASDLTHLRGGLVKIGSGDDIGLASPVEFLGARLATVGAAPKV